MLDLLKTKKIIIITLVVILTASSLVFLWKTGKFKKSIKNAVEIQEPSIVTARLSAKWSEQQIKTAFSDYKKDGQNIKSKESRAIIDEINQKTVESIALDQKVDLSDWIQDEPSLGPSFRDGLFVATNSNGKIIPIDEESPITTYIEKANAAQTYVVFDSGNSATLMTKWKDKLTGLETQLENIYGDRINNQATNIVMGGSDYLCNLISTRYSNPNNAFCAKPSTYNGAYSYNVPGYGSNQLYLATDMWVWNQSRTGFDLVSQDDAKIEKLFVHEMAHAFRGSKLFPKQTFEEGSAEAAVAALYPNDGYDSVGITRLQTLNLPSRVIYGYNSIPTWTYVEGCAIWTKYYIEDPRFFINWHKELAKISDTSTLTIDQLVALTERARVTIEGTSTTMWFGARYAYYYPSVPSDPKYIDFSPGYAAKNTNSYAWMGKNIATYNIKTFDASGNLISTLESKPNTDPKPNPSPDLDISYYCDSNENNCSSIRHQLNYAELLGGSTSTYYNNYYGRLKFEVSKDNYANIITQYSLKPHNTTNPIIGAVTGGGQQAKLYNDSNNTLLETVTMFDGMFEFTESSAHNAGRYRIEIITNGSRVNISYFNKPYMSQSASVILQTRPGPINLSGSVSLATNPAGTTSVNSGSAISLTWGSSNIQSCSFTNGTVRWRSQSWSSSGNFTSEALTANTTFALSCTDTSGTVLSASVSIAVTVPPPPTSSIDLKANGFSPLTINSSSSVLVTWSGSNVGLCTKTVILGTDPAWTGSASGTSGSYNTPVLNESTTYKLDCASSILGAPNVITEIKIIFSIPVISKGHCTFKGNNKVNAVMLCQTEFKLDSTASNSYFTGSFVADEFKVTSGLYNIDFIYNPQLDNSWPPAFRYLNMPSPKETGNVE